jgi:hypothetical protein
MNTITAHEFIIFTAFIIVSYYIRKILRCINTIEKNIKISNHYVDAVINEILDIVHDNDDIMVKYLPSKKDELKYKEFFLVLEECIDSFSEKELEDVRQHVKNNYGNDKAILVKFETEKRIILEKFKKDTMADAKIKLFDIKHKNIHSLISYYTIHGHFNPAIDLLKSMIDSHVD